MALHRRRQADASELLDRPRRNLRFDRVAPCRGHRTRPSVARRRIARIAKKVMAQFII
jgi:hypothetical protein